MSDQTKPTAAAVATAEKAIGHVLRQIRDNANIGWYLGHGTQSFSALTEAFALLTGEPVKDVRDAFRPLRAADPCKVTVEEAGRALWQVSHRYTPKTWADVDEHERQVYASQERSLFADHYCIGFEANKGGEEE